MTLLTAIFAIPLLAALLVAVIPGNYRFVIRCVALAATFAAAALATRLFVLYDPALAQMQFAQQFAWADALGIRLRVGVDGINAGLILMGAWVAFAATCAAREIASRQITIYEEVYAWFLIPATALLLIALLLPDRWPRRPRRTP